MIIVTRQAAVKTALLLWTLVGADACAEDWPCLRGPSRSGISSEPLQIKGRDNVVLQTHWQKQVGVGFSCVVISGRHVIATGNQDQRDTVYCIDAVTGQDVWDFSYEAPLDARDFEGGTTSTPTIYDGSVYVFSRQGDLFCLDLESGQLQWRQQIADLAEVRIPAWGFGGSPVVHDDLLLLSAGEAGVAVNRRSGALVWASADKEAGYASPLVYALGEQSIALFPSGRSFTAVEVLTGRPIWQQRWLTTFGCNAADPIVHDGKVFLCSGYNRGGALLEPSGGEVETVWKSKAFQNQMHTSILIDGLLYGINGDMESGASLSCIKLATGESIWTSTEVAPGGISAAGKTLIVVTTDGRLVLADASSGGFEPWFSEDVLTEKCWTTPVLSGGRIYCRSISGKVVCLSLQ